MGDRATIHPSFDVEEYARESDARVLAEDAAKGSISQVVAREALVHARADVGDEELEEVYWACLGGPDHVPVLARPRDELLTLPRTSAAGFVISYIDGLRTIAAVIAASQLPELAALDALYELVERGAVELRRQARPPR
jgi:hypothetical protein